MTATIAVRMPNDVYLQRLRVLGAWWRLGSSALNPDLLIEHVEYGAFVTDIRHATCRVAAESGHGRPPDEELRPFNHLELDSGHRQSIPAGISAGPPWSCRETLLPNPVRRRTHGGIDGSIAA